MSEQVFSGSVWLDGDDSLEMQVENFRDALEEALKRMREDGLVRGWQLDGQQYAEFKVWVCGCSHDPVLVPFPEECPRCGTSSTASTSLPDGAA